LVQRSRELQERGERLVLTNGCFDILHLGHVRYLQAARERGDALAVGLNSDASVRRLKGAGRPINPENERAEILASLEIVDFVTIFDEDTAEQLVAEIRPAVYAKGGDYSADPSNPNFPPEGLIVLARGGEVAILDLVEGRSTTALLNRMRAE
jgi:rfaE bifunctional protein nucleotidyltransferase chain/domain